MTSDIWPRCAKCGAAYTLTIGLPVTVQPVESDHMLVEIDVDLGELTDIDDSCSVSCSCATTDDEAIIEALVPWLERVREAALKTSGAIVNLRDAS